MRQITSADLPPDVRQVNRDELAYALVTALKKVSAATLNALRDSRHAQRSQAQAMVAMQLAEGLGRFEILSTTPLPALMGESTYSTPLARMLGEDVPSGVVPTRDEASD
jgi:hypothetical protein